MQGVAKVEDGSADEVWKEGDWVEKDQEISCKRRNTRGICQVSGTGEYEWLGQLVLNQTSRGQPYGASRLESWHGEEEEKRKMALWWRVNPKWSTSENEKTDAENETKADADEQWRNNMKVMRNS